MKVHYITGNKGKFDDAKILFEKEKFTVIQKELKIDETQDIDSLMVAKNKAKQAWEILGKPLFINDASWSIKALKGFPGPYMKYINQWFTPEDFINLMKNKKDRAVILKDTIVYVDSDTVKTFTKEYSGILLKTPYRGSFKNPSDAVISLSPSKKSIAEEVKSNNIFLQRSDLALKDFIEWLRSYLSSP